MIWTWIRDCFHEMRYSCRLLAKKPGFVMVAVVSLALGIGANLAIFSLLNAILLRALPVPNPHELRLVNWVAPKGPAGHFSGADGGDYRQKDGQRCSGTFSYAAYRDLGAGTKGLADVFAFRLLNGLVVRTNQEVGVSCGLMVSGNYFKCYGGRAAIGRTLLPEDDVTGAEPSAVITHRFWKLRLGGNPNVLGRTISIDRNEFTVVGILPSDYVGPITGDPADIYVPMAAQPKLLPLARNAFENYDIWWVRVAARIKPGVSDAQLNAALAAAFARVKSLSVASKMEKAAIQLNDGSRGVIVARQKIAPALGALQGLVATILLIACLNIAGLLLARAAARQREYAVCAALGAGRMRLIRQSLTDSLLLAIGGAVFGVICARWIRDGLLQFLPPSSIALHLDTSFDGRVLSFVFGLVFATALMCGLLPAWRATRINPATDLQGARACGSSRHLLGRIVVSAQVALSLILVAATGLFARSLMKLHDVELGFDPENILIFKLEAPRETYQKERLAKYFVDIRDSIASVPGVKSVAYSQMVQASGQNWSGSFKIPGDNAEQDAPANWSIVSDGYFAAMGIPILRGREFNRMDTVKSQPVAVVNAKFARRYFPGREAIDCIVKDGSQVYRIIGVCGDTQLVNLKEETPAAIFFSHPQSAKDNRSCAEMFVIVRTMLAPMDLLPAARKQVAAIDSSIPLTEISTQAERVNQTLFFEQIFSAFCASLAGLAVLLSCIGLYGILSYNVARRTAEIGVRVAIGARPADVIGSVMHEALSMTAWGMAIGLPLALGIGYTARSLFFGIKPYDPVMIGGTVLLMVAVAGVAAWLPARGAARVDPIRALRCE